MPSPICRGIARASFFILLLGSCSRASTTNAPDELQAIHRFVDAWHLAAAEANAETFFGSIADSGIYIGTDASERWTKDEFRSFAQPYFDRGSAWDFKPRDRDLHISSDGTHAWFSELLTTWMGECRGSGILVKTSGGWKVAQYHLSVTVPNDIIRDFIQLVDEYDRSLEK
jgi:hypothetical protein